VRLLLTGAAGSIGSVLTVGLGDAGHDVVGLDLVVPETWPGDPDGWYTVDCTDPDAVAAVFADLDRSGGVDAVVHLAGIPDETTLRDELESHVVTTGVLLDAMVAHGVSRMVYAGSNHAVGRTPRTDRLAAAGRPRPAPVYGVAKVAAEAQLSQ
jgi:uronate dehydrogenase